MIPDFEPGTPASGEQLSHALGALLASGVAYLSTFSAEQFFTQQGPAWSPADHVRHLELSTRPLTQALGVPRWLLALRFGRGSGHSRTFTEVRAVYLQALANGGQAGRFTPRAEPAAGDRSSRRQEIVSAWSSATVDLQHAITCWPERALDHQVLPHPLLGLLTVREMLAFTVYHTAHHLRRIAERAAPAGA
jgi:hypothetical protein